MNKLSDIIGELQKLSTHELYRLSVWIRNEIELPQRAYEIRNKFKIGDRVQWFNRQNNREQPVIVKNKGRTKVTIETEDLDLWDTPYYTINTEQLKTILPSNRNTKLTKNDFSIGEDVEFSCDGNIYSGKIIRLNPKTASICISDHQTWRVSYHFLTKLIDSNANYIVGELL